MGETSTVDFVFAVCCHGYNLVVFPFKFKYLEDFFKGDEFPPLDQ